MPSRLWKKFRPRVVAIYETCDWLDKKGVDTCQPMNKGGSQQVGAVTVTMTHAVHSCGISDDDGSIVYGGEAAGYVLKFDDGRTAYFSGRYERVHGHAVDRGTLQAGSGLPADRRLVHDESARSRSGVPFVGGAGRDPDALRDFPAAHRNGRTHCRNW